MSSILKIFDLRTAGKVTLFQKVTTFSLLLFPILHTYGMPGLNSSIAYVVTTLLGLIFFMQKQSANSYGSKKGKVPHYLVLYFIYAIISRVITAGSINFIPFDLIILLLFVNLYFGNVNFSYFFKAYRLVALICIVFFWIQEVSFSTMGVRPTGIIPGLMIISKKVTSAQYAETLAYFARSTSFFCEPAHFAQFLMPLLCLELLGPQKSLLRAVPVAVTLLYLRSGNALLGLAVIAAVYVYQLFKGGLKFRQKIIIILVVLAAVYGGIRFFGTEEGQDLMSRENEVTDTELVGSGFVRLYRGYWLYGDFDILEKTIGVNNNEVLEQHIRNLPTWVFSYGQKDYFNGIQYLLIHNGLIGTLLFLMLYLSLWKRNDLCGKSCILTCVAVSFVAAIHLSSFMFTCLLIAWFRQQDNKVLRVETSKLQQLKS